MDERKERGKERWDGWMDGNEGRREKDGWMEKGRRKGMIGR